MIEFDLTIDPMVPVPDQIEVEQLTDFNEMFETEQKAVLRQIAKYVKDVNKTMKQYSHHIMKPHFREEIINRGDLIEKLLARFV